MIHALLPMSLLLAALAGDPGADVPSPDAMWLGARIVPAALVEGFRRGIEDAVIGGKPGAEAARAAMAPLLDEAFPPELLAGAGASFLAARYTADELRALRDREESPLGRKLRSFEQRAAQLKGETAEEREKARDALSRKMFTAAERADIEAFAATPLGKKSLALAPDLAAHFVDQLDRRWTSVRASLEPRLRAAAERK
jgi:hypothetical protein